MILPVIALFDSGTDAEQGLDRIITMSCKAAVKGGQNLTDAEIRRLTEGPAELDNPYTCPHGRPVIMKLNEHELLENFSNGSSESPDYKPAVAVITGPTASGKSSAALRFAREHNGEIVSADSMQIYKEMDIGTAKPSEEEQRLVPHHLIDIVSPDEPYSVSRFRSDAVLAIDDILGRARLPVVCGGTGLYINALTLPFDLETENTDPKIRAALEELSRTDPVRLYERLREADPESAKAIHPNNLKRIVGALEVYDVTGRPKSELDREGRSREPAYDFRLYKCCRWIVRCCTNASTGEWIRCSRRDCSMKRSGFWKISARSDQHAGHRL